MNTKFNLAVKQKGHPGLWIYPGVTDDEIRFYFIGADWVTIGVGAGCLSLGWTTEGVGDIFLLGAGKWRGKSKGPAIHSSFSSCWI